MNVAAGIFAVIICVVGGCSAAWAQTGAAPAAATAASADAARILREFFAQENEAARGDLAVKFAAVAPKSLDELRPLLRQALPLAKVEAGQQTFETKPDGVVPAVKYLVRVPSGYKPDAGALSGTPHAAGWPLVLTMHGTGGTGDAQLALTVHLLGQAADDYLIVCPQSPQEGMYKFDQLVVDYPVCVLNDARRRLLVDSDRVIVTGYSRGGYTAWGTALFRPGEWAAAVPMASFALTDAGRYGCKLYMQNVLSLAVQHHWGDKDVVAGQTEGIQTFARLSAEELKRLGAKKFEPLEYAGAGHSLPIDDKRFREFLAAARRGPPPGEFAFIFHHLWEGRAFYVRALAAAKGELDFKHLPSVRVSSPDEVESAAAAMIRKEAFELSARARPTDNAVVIKARNLRELEVEIVSGLVDLSRPVKVVVNDRVVFSKKLNADWAVLLEAARSTGDLERLVLARLPIQVPQK